MKNFLSKFSLGLMAAVGAVVAFANHVKAAADADFAAAATGSSAMINDNTPTVLTYITSTGGKALIIGVLITLVYFGIKMIRGSIGGGKRRR